MSTYEIKLSHGTGANAHYRVYQDGTWVADLERPNISRWRVRERYYGWSEIASWKTIEQARRAIMAGEITFPTEREVYEAICEDVRRRRRDWIKREKSDSLYGLVRVILDGDPSAGNDARIHTRALLNEIDRFSTDMSDRGTSWSYYNSRVAPNFPRTPEDNKLAREERRRQQEAWAAKHRQQEGVK
jgi:hypothetical protein